LKRIALLAVVSLVFAACFNDWQGDVGSFSIGVGSSDGAVAIINGIPIANFRHVITLSDGPGVEQSRSIEGAGSVKFSVIPGKWTVTIKAYVTDRGENAGYINGDEPLASGSVRVEIKPGPNDVITVPMDWRKFTVTFDSNGGTEVLEQRLHDGKKAKQPQGVTRNGYTLEGWYTEAEFINKWNFGTSIVTQNLTLYAKWNINPFGVGPISFPDIVDAAPIILDQVISLSGNNGDTTITLTVDNPGQYSSIDWYITGTNVHGSGSSFILNSANPAYNSIGEYSLTLEVWKDGKPYSKSVIFTVVK
jgi:uncharacterized repeat protein (TIGR02543 family)